MIDRFRFAASGLIVVTLIWIGLLVGVSFLATPAKFLAPSLTLPVALDVGRQTFGIFAIVEIVAALPLLVFAAMSGKSWHVWTMAIIAGGLVAVQSLWLLPVLDTRVEIILQGGGLDPTFLHELYIAVDLVKLALLSLLAWSGFRLRRDSGVAGTV